MLKSQNAEHLDLGATRAIIRYAAQMMDAWGSVVVGEGEGVSCIKLAIHLDLPTTTECRSSSADLSGQAGISRHPSIYLWLL